MLGRGLTLFRLLGIEVKLDLSWLLLALLIGWTLSAGLFPVTFPGLSARSYLWMGVVGTIGIFFSLVFHEFAHSLVARRYGLPVSRITLFLFGGVAEMEEEPSQPRQELLMALAGPIASLFLAAAFFGLYVLAFAAGGGLAETGSGVAGGGPGDMAPDGTVPGGMVPVGLMPLQVTGVLLYLAWINGILAVFNMVPAFPLDGGRVLRSVLWGWKGDLAWATRIASRIGEGFGILLIVLGLMSVLGGNLIGGLWWFLIGLFIRAAAQASYSQTMTRAALTGVPVRRLMRTDPVTVPPDLSVGALIEDYFYRYYYKFYPVVEDGRLIGSVSSREVKILSADQRARVSVGDIMLRCSPDTVVAPQTEATVVLAQMQRTGTSRLLVADDGRLEGLVSLKDMLDFLSMTLDFAGTRAPGREPDLPARHDNLLSR